MWWHWQRFPRGDLDVFIRSKLTWMPRMGINVIIIIFISLHIVFFFFLSYWPLFFPFVVAPPPGVCGIQTRVKHAEEAFFKE